MTGPAVLPRPLVAVVWTWFVTAALLPLAGFVPLVFVAANPPGRDGSAQVVTAILGIVSLPFGLLFGGLMVWIAVMLRRGRPWARVVALLIGALALLLVVLSAALLGGRGLGAAMFFAPGPFLVALAGLVTIPGLLHPSARSASSDGA